MIAIYAFNAGNTLEWPPSRPHHSTGSAKAIDNPGARDAFVTSIKVGVAATAIALVLGTLASLAVARHRFFGRETISFLVVLPIALPGIVTGIALNNTFTQVLGIDLSLFTVVVGHATFCIVRRLQQRDRAAAAGLGLARGGVGRPRRAHLADLPATSPCPTCGRRWSPAPCSPSRSPSTRSSSPSSRSAPASETLPIWIFNNLFRSNQLPIVNVVAVIVIVISIIPVYFANKLSQDAGGAGGRGGGGKPDPVSAEATAAP